MNLKGLKKRVSLELAKTLGLNFEEQTRKPATIEAIEALEADNDELSECLELIAEREQLKRKAKERNDKHMVEETKLLEQEWELESLQPKYEELQDAVQYEGRVTLEKGKSEIVERLKKLPGVSHEQCKKALQTEHQRVLAKVDITSGKEIGKWRTLNHEYSKEAKASWNL